MRDSTTSMKSFAVGTCERAWTRDGRWSEGKRQEPRRREEEPRREGVSAEVGGPHLGERRAAAAEPRARSAGRRAEGASPESARAGDAARMTRRDV